MVAGAAAVSNKLKQIVGEKYSQIALNSQKSGYCGKSNCCDELGFSMMSNKTKLGYSNVLFVNGDTSIFSITVSGTKVK